MKTVEQKQKKAEYDRTWIAKNPNYKKEYYHKNKDKFREYGRNRYKRVPEEYSEKSRKYRLENNEKYNECRKKWRKENVHKTKAHSNLHTAVENGSVVKKPCMICGNITVEGHHEDYSKPLEVLWLCKKHHHEKHRIHNRIHKGGR